MRKSTFALSSPRRGLGALALGLALSTVALPSTARAQNAQEIAVAKQTAQEAFASYKAGDFEKALKLFEQAKAIYPSGNILRMYAYSLVALEKWEGAADELEAALATKTQPLDANDRKDTEAQLAKVMERFHKLTVMSSVDGAELVIDGGSPYKLPLDKPLRLRAGSHVLTIRASGFADNKVETDLAGGKESKLELDPKKIEKEAPPPPPPPPTVKKKVGWFSGQDTAGLVVLGGGLAVGAAAAALGGSSVHYRGLLERDISLHEQKFGERCAVGSRRECLFDRAIINRDATREEQLRLSAIGLGIGAGVLVVAGTGLYLFSEKGPLASTKEVPADDAPKPPPPPSARRSKTTVACMLAPGPDAVALGCGGRFE